MIANFACSTFLGIGPLGMALLRPLQGKFANLSASDYHSVGKSLGLKSEADRTTEVSAGLRGPQPWLHML